MKCKPPPGMALIGYDRDDVGPCGIYREGPLNMG